MDTHNLSTCVVLLMFSYMCWKCFGQDRWSRTDNCTGTTFESCGDDKCCCKKKFPGGYANCTGFGKLLQYIPSLPIYINRIEFTQNYIPYISERVLSNISSHTIETLSLADNNISSLSPHAFATFKGLSVLALSDNLDINLNQLRIALGSCKSVKRLILDNIGLESINDSIFDTIKSPHLYEISIRRNPLRMLRSSVFLSLHNLEKLLASKCMLSQMHIEQGLSQLRTIDLAENLFQNQPDFCSIKTPEYAMRNLKYISLSKNGIRFLNSDVWSCLLDLQHLDLAENKLVTLHKNSFSIFQSLIYLDLGEMTTIDTIDDWAFNNSNLQNLNFRSNKFLFKKNDIFQGLTNLKLIDISENDLHFASIVRLFSPMKNLEKILMNNAKVHQLSDDFLRLFPNLSEFNANSNIIANIHNTFKSVRRISKLDLHTNRISNIQREDLPGNLLKTLKYLDLSGNEFACTCSLRWFRNWVSDTAEQKTIRLKGWPHHFWCQTPRRYPLIQFNPTEESCSTHNYLWTIVPVITSCIFVIMLINVVIYRKRWYLRYWIYKLRKKRRTDPEEQHLLEDGDHIRYDGYVVYHDDDSEFVHKDLIDIMERQHNFKLHVWQRDAEPGLKLELMFDGIHASRNVMCVVSNNFLKDSYCLFQLKVALDRQVETEKEFLFIVLLGDIDYKSLSKYWCAMLTQLPTAVWCQEEGDIKRSLFEQKMLDFFED